MGSCSPISSSTRSRLVLSQIRLALPQPKRTLLKTDEIEQIVTERQAHPRG